MSEAASLTDNEGMFLALVLRIQPVTAYQVAKVYEDSPVSNFNTSRGKIYPLIRRLKERGLLETKQVSDDARGTELLSCTKAGARSVREWVKQVRPHHLLLEDPLRTKVQSFDLLSREEQIEWIVEIKAQLHHKLEELEAYGREVEVPYKMLVHDNAVSSLRARMDWLDRALQRVVRGQAEE